ncbi:MAG: N-acetyltransferase family protein [Capsulimonadaceae bacterium]
MRSILSRSMGTPGLGAEDGPVAFDIGLAAKSCLKDGTHIRIRPIGPADEAAMVEFHCGLSDHTVYMRYFHLMGLAYRSSHERLAAVCRVDPAAQLVFVAEVNFDTNVSGICGVARLARPTPPGAMPVASDGHVDLDANAGARSDVPAVPIRHGDLNAARPATAEFAVLVADAYQGRGMGRALLKHIITAAVRAGITEITGDILPENYAMTHLCERAGFTLRWDRTENVVRASLRVPS